MYFFLLVETSSVASLDGMQTFWSPGHQPPQRSTDRHAGSASPYGFVYIGSPGHSHAPQQQLYSQRVLALRPELQLLQRPLLEQQLQLQQQMQPSQSLPQQQMPRRIVAPGLGAGDPMRVGSGHQLSSVGLPESEYLPSPVALYAGSRRPHAGSAQALASLQLSRLMPVPFSGMAGMASSPHSPASAGPTPVPLPMPPLARPPAPSQQGAAQTARTQLYSSGVPPLQSPSPFSTFAPATSNLVYSPSHSSQQQLQQLPVQQSTQFAAIATTNLSAPPPLVQPGEQAGRTQAATSGSNPTLIVEQSSCGSPPSPSTPGAQQTSSKPVAPGQPPTASTSANLSPFSSVSNARAGVAGESAGGGGSSNSGTPTPSQSSALSGRSSLSSYDGVSPARGSSTTQGQPFVSSSRVNFLQLLRDGVPVQCEYSFLHAQQVDWIT